MKTDTEQKPDKHKTKHQCAPGLLSQDQVYDLADQLKALAHPVRLQILQHLGNWDKCCCNDFCACIPLAQSTISQHLKILHKAGIINYVPAGNCSHYSIVPDALDQVLTAIANLQKPLLNKLKEQ